MNDPCPRTADVSAYLDEELTDRDRMRMQVHLVTCPRCEAMLSNLRALHGDLRALPGPILGFDLGAVVEGRLATMPRLHRSRRTRSWWRLVPAGIGAAASLSFGLFMGLAVTAGPVGGVAPAMAQMAVFGAIAPGGLCAASACLSGSVAR